MKWNRPVRLTAAMTAILLALTASLSAEPLAVLAIGNSFAGNATEFLDEVTEAGGREIVIGLAITAGAPLDRHATRAKLATDSPDEPLSHPYRNTQRYLPGYPVDQDPGGDGRIGGDEKVSLRDALTYRPWGVVTIQQASYESYKPETYEPHATELIALIRETNPDARILIHQTWAYRIDSPRLAQWKMTQPQMHAGLVDAYDRLARTHGLLQIPVGNAFALARSMPMWQYVVDESYDLAKPIEGKIPDQHGSLTVGHYWRNNADTGEPELRLDAFHAGIAGRYLAACVWYEVLFAADVREAVGYKPSKIDDEQAVSLRTIAHRAVAAQREKESQSVE